MLIRKKFTLPDGLSCKTFVMRELTARDEVTAAVWADKLKTSGQGDNVLHALSAEQREAQRLSLVSVDGVAVNTDGEPYMELDTWTFRTLRFLQAAFADVNGVDVDDLADFTKGAEIVAESRPHEVTTGG